MTDIGAHCGRFRTEMDALPYSSSDHVMRGGGGGDIGPAMAAHEDIDKIIFTGSTRTGKAIRAAAAPTLKKLTLELGGNDAGIVLPDADPQAIAQSLF